MLATQLRVGGGLVDHPTPLHVVVARGATPFPPEVVAIAVRVGEVDAHRGGTAKAVEDVGHIGVTVRVGRDQRRLHAHVAEQRARGELELATAGQQEERQHQNPEYLAPGNPAARAADTGGTGRARGGFGVDGSGVSSSCVIWDKSSRVRGSIQRWRRTMERGLGGIGRIGADFLS